MTNQEVANLIGLSHSSVSRIRKGERSPSLGAMVRIDASLDWPIDQQVTAKIEGVYAAYFEGQIDRITSR